MKCKGWQQLRANAKNGISMALVLCVSAFFIAFAAAILYTAGMLTAQSNQRLKEERCYQLAKSYSDVLKNELTKYDKKYTDDGSTVGDGTFYAFANKFLDDEKYLEYNSDYKDSTKYNFVEDGSNLSDISSSPLSDKGYGNISVTLKKEQNSDENVDKILSGGEITGSSGGDYSSAIKNIENTTVRQYIFTVEVTAYFGDAVGLYTHCFPACVNVNDVIFPSVIVTLEISPSVTSAKSFTSSYEIVPVPLTSIVIAVF